MVNINHSKLYTVNQPNLKVGEKIYKTQQKLKKEYGLETTLLVSHFIKWKHPKQQSFYTSPLFCQPVQIRKNLKIELKFEYQLTHDNWFINPVMVEQFKSIFNLDIPNSDKTEVVDFLIEQLESNGSQISQNNNFNYNENWQIIELPCLGIFNYKKSILTQDYASILKHPNQTLSALLTGNVSTNTTSTQLNNLINADLSQTKAIQLALNENMVIQGPPGTGKSNTIVELIKQYLLNGKKILFVSEKKSALDVVYNRLKSENLHQLAAYFDGNENQKKSFYKHLKGSLKQLQNHKENKFIPNMSQQKLALELNEFFQIYPQKLTQINQSKGVSIQQILNTLIGLPKTNLPEIKTNIPAFKTWHKYAVFLEELEQLATQYFNVQTLGQLPFLRLNKSLFEENDFITILNSRLTELASHLQSFEEIKAIYNLKWEWNEWQKYSVAASVLQTVNQSQLDILDPNSKKYKAFDRWSKKYELHKLKFEQASKAVSHWNVKPKPETIEALKLSLNQKTNAWLALFSSNKAQNAFKHYKYKLNTQQKLKALEDLEAYYKIEHELKEITLKLKHNLGLLNPDLEIDQLLMTRRKLESTSHQHYVYLLEHENSKELIQDLHQVQIKTQQVNQVKRFIFTNYFPDNFADFRKQVNTLKEQLSLLQQYTPEIKKALSLPQDLLSFITQNKFSFDVLNEIIVRHTLHELILFEPHLKNLNGKGLLNNFKTFLKLLKENQTQQVEAIVNPWQERWHKFEALTQTPNSKLSASDKQLKKDFKVAKKLIFHEAGKQQQHLPIKTLLQQSQSILLDLLPIWIINPLSISENIICQPDLFDIIIFDEASQIPLEDAIPSIYRSKQMVVVGDTKQMPPSQFFSHAKETTSLLAESESVFKSEMLKIHYRSQHPNLMQFSNENFYDNELSYFPPSIQEPPVKLFYVEQGKFEQGKNVIEAKKVAEIYQELLVQNKTDVGIIAFSKEQELTIRTAISALNLKDNANLLIRNLENTQGIEKDYIIISIGYGYNEKGIFRHHFGPINQDFGANRLNVLLTRSKKQMLVCTSVTASDFKLTANSGVQLVEGFIRYAENIQTSTLNQPQDGLLNIIGRLFEGNTNIQFYPAKHGQIINSFINNKSNKILLVDPGLNPGEGQDIYTILFVLTQRFKEVKVVLSQEYIDNPEKTTLDILEFMA
ncbi:MAG: AAA domain-containing protein [Putridiphycobacter sp.]